MAAIFYRALDAGSRSPVPQWRRRPPMNQSAAFKDFFLIPWIRQLAIPRLEYLTRYLTAFLIVSSHPFLLIASPSPSPSRLCLSTWGWSVCWQRAERKRKREGEGRKKERKPLEIGNARKRSGCRVGSCSRVDPARVREWDGNEKRKRRISWW